jgi:hypothetical protein
MLATANKLEVTQKPRNVNGDLYAVLRYARANIRPALPTCRRRCTSLMCGERVTTCHPRHFRDYPLDHIPASDNRHANISRRSSAVGLVSSLARGHGLRSYGSHRSNISENAAIISYIAASVNRVEIYFFPMASDRFFLYPGTGKISQYPAHTPFPLSSSSYRPAYAPVKKSTRATSKKAKIQANPIIYHTYCL